MDKSRYIQSYAKIIGLKEDDVISYVEKKGIASLIDNTDELLVTKIQREKHKAFIDLYRMSGEIYHENPLLTSPKEVAVFMRSVMEHIHDKEAVVVAFVDTKVRLLDYEEVSLGTLSNTLIHPREIFRGAILNKAESIIICHNHPSGNVTPSGIDLRITERLQEAGELIGIKVLDHVIISGINENDFYSFRENELIKEYLKPGLTQNIAVGENINDNYKLNRYLSKRKQGITRINISDSLAREIVDFMENYDKAFGYTCDVKGQSSKEEWIHTVKEAFLNGEGKTYMEMVAKLKVETVRAMKQAVRIETELIKCKGEQGNERASVIEETEEIFER